MNHVPKNFGEKGAGSVKADEWHLLATIYLPIALVLLWGEHVGPNAAHFSELLQHAMALFQATTIISRYTTSNARRTAYLDFIKHWLGNLTVLYPHTKTPRTRSNPHIAMHIYNFLSLFGPAVNWWAFPVERRIGQLGKINSNDHLGGRLLSMHLQTSKMLIIFFRPTRSDDPQYLDPWRKSPSVDQSPRVSHHPPRVPSALFSLPWHQPWRQI